MRNTWVFLLTLIIRLRDSTIKEKEVRVGERPRGESQRKREIEREKCGGLPGEGGSKTPSSWFCFLF
jgi:hypothetical protein